MRYTEENYKKCKIQHNRTDYEAVVLQNYLKEFEKLITSDIDTQNEVKRLTDETMKKLNISDGKILDHKIMILSGLCEDDELEWREQKYGKQ